MLKDLETASSTRTFWKNHTWWIGLAITGLGFLCLMVGFVCFRYGPGKTKRRRCDVCQVLAHKRITHTCQEGYIVEEPTTLAPVVQEPDVNSPLRIVDSFSMR